MRIKFYVAYNMSYGRLAVNSSRPILTKLLKLELELFSSLITRKL